ncbi:helix-turn-helix domain-containing protein [Paenibacillus sp. MER 99-2]|uniref:helix-turn-helix domain-containing protein n=1 Tax=Paenibacillus sp. MER 99-2 TaxID=2939572 RepID=UPI00203DE081|nr:helix-turn-helix domain-containing protein [Paenibacillus sp. MER 99-2]MCM3171819.1 helix-turn-helix domain-containing protein [Paenibacillus sp. MER 99-2]
MYRLLIVDDEEIITDSLYETFSRHMPDQLDVCKAYSAMEALNWMRRTRMDMVLTDIRMPGMSGLELTEEIQTQWPQCRIIFLTGHSDFDYAYRALQMPNVRYLLKTEGYDKVLTMVEQVMEEISQSHHMLEVLEQSREIQFRLDAFQQEQYVRQLLQDCNSAPISRSEMSEMQTELTKRNIELQADAPVHLVLGRFNTPLDAGIDLRHVQDSIRIIGSSLLSEQSTLVTAADHHGDVIWLLQPKREKSYEHNQFTSYIEGTLELVQAACLASLDMSIAFTLSGRACAWSQIPRQYERLRLLQWMKIGDGVSMVLTDNYEGFAAGAVKDPVRISSRIDVMSGYLETGRYQSFYDIFEELVGELMLQEMTMERAMETYYHLALMLYSTCNRWGLQQGTTDQRSLLQLGDYACIKDAVQSLYRTADELVHFKRSTEEERTNLVIQTLGRYIKDNLEKDLSLVRLAELNHFNPSYLSRLFKQEMGINLSEYIDECRIRKAKQLLHNTDLMVREVALQVGYESAHSFTRLFKKLTGMTPQEYRESLLVR